MSNTCPAFQQSPLSQDLRSNVRSAPLLVLPHSEEIGGAQQHTKLHDRAFLGTVAVASLAAKPSNIYYPPAQGVITPLGRVYTLPSQTNAASSNICAINSTAPDVRVARARPAIVSRTNHAHEQEQEHPLHARGRLLRRGVDARARRGPRSHGELASLSRSAKPSTCPATARRRRRRRCR